MPGSFSIDAQRVLWPPEVHSPKPPYVKESPTLGLSLSTRVSFPLKANRVGGELRPIQCRFSRDFVAPPALSVLHPLSRSSPSTRGDRERKRGMGKATKVGGELRPIYCCLSRDFWPPPLFPLYILSLFHHRAPGQIDRAREEWGRRQRWTRERKEGMSCSGRRSATSTPWSCWKRWVFPRG